MKTSFLVTLFFLLSSIGIAVENDAELRAAVADHEKEVHARQEPIARELEVMLGDDTKLTLYSVAPAEIVNWKVDGKRDGIDIFHDRVVRGFAAIDDRKEIGALVHALVASIRKSDGTVAMCFEPHHGLIVERGAKRIELLICFSCLQGLTFGSKSPSDFLVTETPLSVFNAALKRHKLPLPENPERPIKRTTDNSGASPLRV